MAQFHATVAHFVSLRLKRTSDCMEFVTFKDTVQAFESFTGSPIVGALPWFRRYLQKVFRVTYNRVDGKAREMVLFGGVTKGLRLVGA